MKWIDIPPVWLVGFLALAYVLGTLIPNPAFGDWSVGFGRWLVGSGLALMLASLWEFGRARTTPVPHRQPSALITSGIFRFTRNPIYLGDAIILAGAISYWGAALPLILVPAFVLLIQQRFINAEEDRLHIAFPEAFSTYKARVRRWI